MSALDRLAYRSKQNELALILGSKELQRTIIRSLEEELTKKTNSESSVTP
jgi:hypothetical protein